MVGIFAGGGSRTPGSFTGGAWSIALPLLILLVLFWAVLRSPPGPAPSPSPVMVTMLVPVLERLPGSLGGHYELWVSRAEGGEDRLAAFSALTGGELLALGGEPVQTFPVSDLPPVGSVLLLTVEQGIEPAIVRSDRVLLRGTLTTTETVLEPVLPPTEGKHAAMLLTPTDPKTPDTSGLWFAKPGKAKGQPLAPGLALPTPPAGWLYGGFVTTASGTTLPTGAFRDAGAADQGSPFLGKGRGLGVPGEDFVTNPPDGVTFPLNLADGRTTVTIGLLPDFAADARVPFLSLLTTRVPYRQKSATPFTLAPVAAEEFPRGVVTFAQQGV